LAEQVNAGHGDLFSQMGGALAIRLSLSRNFFPAIPITRAS